MPNIIQQTRKFRVLLWTFCGFLGGCILVSIVGNTGPVPGGLYFVFAVITFLFAFWTGKRTSKDNTKQAVAVAVAKANAAADARAQALAQVIVNNGEQTHTIESGQEHTRRALRAHKVIANPFSVGDEEYDYASRT